MINSYNVPLVYEIYKKAAPAKNIPILTMLKINPPTVLKTVGTRISRATIINIVVVVII
jgi:hypothetical protein